MILKTLFTEVRLEMLMLQEIFTKWLWDDFALQFGGLRLETSDLGVIKNVKNVRKSTRRGC